MNYNKNMIVKLFQMIIKNKLYKIWIIKIKNNKQRSKIRKNL